LCEGKTDKKYIESHLEFEELDEKKLIILSVGGSFALKDIYSYLVLALKDRRPAIKGKVFCLLDTDLAYDKFESVDSIPQIRIRRLLLREDLTDVDLLKTTDNKLSPPTEIEDALDGLFFYETIYRIYKNGDKRFSFIENVEILCSNVAAGIMDLTTSQKQIIKNYFDEPGKKNFFCDQYIDVLYESDEIHTPTWLNDIVDFFSE